MRHQHNSDCKHEKHGHMQETALFIAIVSVVIAILWFTTENENNDLRARQHCRDRNGVIEELGTDAMHPLRLPKWTCVTPQ